MDFLKKLIAAIIAAFRATPPPPADEEPDVVSPPVTPATTEGQEQPVPSEGDKHDDQPPDSGFVWKPVSDGDGKLAIITPYQFEFKRVYVEWQRAGIKVINTEEGHYVGRGNGHRQAWRFRFPGKHYGRKVNVVCVGVGERKDFLIPHGAKRFETRVSG